LVIALVLAWVGRAHAATVVLLEPARSTPATKEALFRLQGELLAVGLEVELRARPSGFSQSLAPQTELERIAERRHAIAIIDVNDGGAAISVEIWIFERGAAHVQVSRVALEPEPATRSETLAIRAIEVLRSRFLELALSRRESKLPPPPPPAARPAPPPPSPRGPRFGLEAGAAISTGVDGVGPALLPLVRFDWRPGGWLLAQLTAGALGTSPTVERGSTSAEVAQQYAAVGVCYCPQTVLGLSPLLALSAGVLRTTLDGRAELPERAHFVAQWSAVFEGAIGARLQLPGRYFLTLASHVQLAQPYVAVHFADQVVATSGRPNLLFPLTFGAWL
jgi:hypothetical protein